MNEQQHDAKVARDYAESDVRRARAQLTGAIEVLRVAEEELQRAVEADKASWYGTP